MAVVGELPQQLGGSLLEAARAAFTSGLQITAVISAALVIGIAILTVTLLRPARTG